MAASVFADKSKEPASSELDMAQGETAAEKLASQLATDFCRYARSTTRRYIL